MLYIQYTVTVLYILMFCGIYADIPSCCYAPACESPLDVSSTSVE